MGTPSLLEQLAFPRENGTPALAEAQAVLDSALRAVSLTPQAEPFSCALGRTEAAAVALVLAALFLVWASVRRRGLLLGAGLSLGLAAAAGSGGLDPLLPAQPQANLVVLVPPRGVLVREVLLTAHYDSKTEPLDHVGRFVLFAGAGVAVFLAVLLTARQRPPRRAAASLAALGLLAVAGQLSLGRFVVERSHGIVDDAAACALLVDLAAQLQARPLMTTQVRFAWLAGEETGAQGSAALAPSLASTAFVNLEGIGAGPRLAYAAFEADAARIHAASPGVVADIVAAGNEAPLRLPVPLWTDAGPLRRAGLPGLTVLTLPRNSALIAGLHGKDDRLQRLDVVGYDKTLRLLQAFLARLDAPASSPTAQPLRRP